MDPRQLFGRLEAALAPLPPASRSVLTIGDLYQRLIPYRSVRNELGVMELAAYEHALLRLLAGEGRHLEVADSEAVEEFRRELASVNPILGVYRDYAGVGVRTLEDPTPERTQDPWAGSARREEATTDRWEPTGRPPAENQVGRPAHPAGDPVESTEVEEVGGYASRDAAAGDIDPPPLPDNPHTTLRLPKLASDAEPHSEEAEDRLHPSPERCECCGMALPSLRGVRFCPYCGEARPRRPCRGCGILLEPDWKFCIRCGDPTDRSFSMAER